MDSKIEIVVFSHISGKVENIHCDSYELCTTGNVCYAAAITKGVKVAVIPWNRVKQINIK